MPAKPDQMTRRDWFRLRLPHANQMLDEPGLESTPSEPQSTLTAGLQPIPHPENHVGLDLSQLPPMREAELSRDQVVMLFDDIEKLATDVQLMQRPSGSTPATTAMPVNAQLATACGWLMEGKIPRVQIRYRWQDALWIDTLESKPTGFRLVRIQHLNRST